MTKSNFNEKLDLLNGYNLEFNLCIELYADKMFINAEDIVIDGRKYELHKEKDLVISRKGISLYIKDWSENYVGLTAEKR